MSEPPTACYPRKMASKFRTDDDEPDENRRASRPSLSESDITELIKKQGADFARAERARDRDREQKTRERHELAKKVDHLSDQISDLYSRDAWDIDALKRLEAEFQRARTELEERDVDMLDEVRKLRSSHEALIKQREIEQAIMVARITTIKWIVAAATAPTTIAVVTYVIKLLIEGGHRP